MSRLTPVWIVIALASCDGAPTPLHHADAPPTRVASLPSASWRASVDAAILRGEHRPVWSAEGRARLANRTHALAATLDDSGVHVGPRGASGVARAPAAGWEVTWSTVGWGRAEAVASLGAVAPTDGGCDPDGRLDVAGACLHLTTYAHGALTEWWRSTPDGLQQGFTVAELPSGRGPLVVDLAVRGGELTVSADAVAVRAGAGALAYDGLAAWDARGVALPARFVARDGGVRIEVDAKGAVAPITIDPFVTTAGWRFETNQDVAKAGTAVSGAGDIDGDGYADVVVGAPQYDDGQADEGAIFVFRGGPTGLSTTATWVRTSNQIQARLGISTGWGDFNGDGYGDVVAGANGWDAVQTNQGGAFVYYGGPAGLSATATVYTVDTANLGLGDVVNGGGDVDGDGDTELLVSAIGADFAFTNAGRAYLFEGDPAGVLTVPSWVQDGTEIGATEGQAFTTAGDVNGDGFGDVILTGRLTNVTQPEEGWARVFHGSASGLSTTAAVTLAMGQANSVFGFAAAGLGDVDGDGYGDIAIGASYWDDTLDDEGAVFVFHGSATGVSTTPTTSLFGGQADGDFGHAVGAAGDVNGDGYADLVVGARLTDVITDEFTSNEAGRATVYLGGVDGIEELPILDTFGDDVQTNFGDVVTGVGDVNGDGFGDVLVGASGFSRGHGSEGAAFLFFGGADAPAALGGFSHTPGFGTSLSPAGDVDADGFEDVIVGAPDAPGGGVSRGEAYVFRGTANGVEPMPSWSVVGASDGTRLGRAVAGVGDVDDDGFADVAVSGSGGGQPSVHVYRGSATGLNTTPTSTLVGTAGSSFGTVLAGVGDVNGDSFDDVLVGDPTAMLSRGHAYLHLGTAAGVRTTSSWTFEGAEPGGLCATAIAGVGDVDGDRFADVVIGCPLVDGTAVDGGSVYLVRGSLTGMQSSTPWTFAGTAQQQLGTSVAGLGDVNGDGLADFAVGAPERDSVDGSPSERAGAVYVFLGARGGGSRIVPGVVLHGEVADEQFGAVVASGGDVDGDGRGDLVVLSPNDTDRGRASVFLGGAPLDEAPIFVLEGDDVDFALSAGVVGADVGGDGFSELFVGAPADDGVVLVMGNAARTGRGGVATPAVALRAGGLPLAPGHLMSAGTSLSVHATARSIAGNTPLTLVVQAAELGASFGPLRTHEALAGLPGLATVESDVTLTGLDTDAAVRWRVRTETTQATAHPGFQGRWTWGGWSTQRGLTHAYVRCSDLDGDSLCGPSDPDEDADGVTDGLDPFPRNPDLCGDMDGDTCDDCTVGTDGFGPEFDVLLGNDGPDQDGDGLCDAGDPDVDGDGRDDIEDPAPLDPEVCGDVDEDSCDDCSVGEADVAEDGPDVDRDGICDATDPDIDGDTLLNGDDPFPTDPLRCRDHDGDDCDDCAVLGRPDPMQDGADTNGNGICDFTDPDDDGDGIPDVDDGEPLDVTRCGDRDEDTCDDCANGPRNEAGDGPDLDMDGLCDAGDDDIDNDGVENDVDDDPRNDRVCSDVDEDTCDDCASRSYDPANDGADRDDDGVCDDGDTDNDNDGVSDDDDQYPGDSNRCGKDADGDGCDDCASGALDLDLDGPDFDEDGLCDNGDPDDDNDGEIDPRDNHDNDPFLCHDFDTDGCDECADGTVDLTNGLDDGPDWDGDGRCDVTDPEPLDTDTDVPDTDTDVPDTDTDVPDTDTDVPDTDTDGGGPTDDTDTDGGGPTDDTDTDGGGPTDDTDTDVPATDDPTTDEGGGDDTDDTDGTGKDKCGCDTSNGLSGAGLAVVALALAARRRRR